MDFPWSLFIDLGIVSVALLFATAMRAKVGFFQRYLVPNALTAGFLLLPFYNFVAPRMGLGTTNLEALIYHLLSISFISMSIRSREGKPFSKAIVGTAVMIVASLTLQGIIGFGLTMLARATVTPDLFPGFGLFVPLGYELGPGQAFAIGLGWESLGFPGASSVGLTFAALGFLWACFGGIFLINLGIARGWLSKQQAEALARRKTRSGLYLRLDEAPVGSRLTTESEAIDSMTVQVAVVAAIYLATYLALTALTAVLGKIGPLGEELAVNLWGLSFIFAAVIALVVRALMGAFKVDSILDNGALTRLSGFSVDLLVASAIGAISAVVVLRYLVPIIVIGTISGVATIVYTLFFASRMFRCHGFERAVMIYGASTGTLPTGLALLRVLDPDFETPVATDYMYGSGIAFFLVIPYILSINLPAYGYARNDPSRYWVLLLLLGVYLAAVLVAARLIAGKGAFTLRRGSWFKAKE
jgi:glutamate:Na+ symporter, ESS family